MLRRLARKMGLAILAVVVVALPVVAGCGGGGSTEARPVVIMGSLGDLTGPNSSSNIPWIEGLKDYLRWLDKHDPLPVNLKWIFYDTKTDYGRVPVGYEWLKGQGTDFFFTTSAIDAEQLRDRFVEDKIPSFMLTIAPAYKAYSYMYSVAYGYPVEGDFMADYIVNTWWPAQGKPGIPKVGFVGANFFSATQTSESLDLAMASMPGKFELYKAPLAPFSTAAWAAEYSKVKDCDIVVLATITNTSATLINDFRNRGYKGVLLGNSLAIMASWTLLRSGSLQNMDGVLGVQGGPVWSDVSAAMTIASQVEPEFQPNDPTVHTSTNWMSGVVYGYMLADCIRRAAAKVGAENVDAAAMDDAFQTVNLDMGWGENWQWYPEHVYHRMLRIMKYNLASDTLTTEYAWHYPPSWAPV